jgi:DNA-binding NtrC family response regulator/pSer/pThr/pTyr-binding forkhead associated (FHA) protein
MSERKPASTETVPLSQSSRQVVGRLPHAAPSTVLVVYHRNGAQAVPLQPGAPVVVGRGPPADLIVPDRSLSRRHAQFTLEEGTLTVQDLGSTNGTRVRGERVPRAAIRPGELVYLGSVVASAHVQATDEMALDVVDSHDRFVAALDREVVRAKHFGEPFTVMLLRAASTGEDEAHVSGWLRRVREQLRPVDVVALYSDDTVEVLLPRTDSAQAREQAESLIRTVAQSAVEATCGVATCPSSVGASAEALVESCRRALETASADGPVQLASAEGSFELVDAERSGLIAEHVVVRSAEMRELFETADRVAATTIPVLLLGETGSGKEVLARAIHENGPRADQPMVCVNCGAIPSQLVESTLFGHVRGAFTGADQASKGVFGAADGGTLLLDEIGELPSSAQVALLRVLESGRLTRVGSAEEIAVDVRVIAATNSDLDAMCEQGKFRRDLLYRINTMTLAIPPLRERVEEIAPMAEYFLEQGARQANRRLEGIDDASLAALERYRWPGNVRELRNVVERAAVIARGSRIELEDLPERVRAGSRASAETGENDGGVEAGGEIDLKTSVRRYEAKLIVDALRAAGGNQTHAAQRLSLPLRTLVHKLKTLGIKKADYQSED